MNKDIVEKQQPKVLQKVEKKEKETKGSSSFSFVGMGDNLIHGAIYYWQMLEQNGYNFDDIYELTNPYVQQADFAYLNQEVICNGSPAPHRLRGCCRPRRGCSPRRRRRTPSPLPSWRSGQPA